MKTVEKITIDGGLIKKVNLAIEAELAYENQTHGKRKLGITGEVGEILICDRLGLQLVLDSRSEGYDAIDKDGLKVQIKTRRSESQELPRNNGRTGRFSKHPFDYALLVILDTAYQLHEVWRAEYNKLNPKIEKQKRRDISISYFKRVGRKIYPSQ